MSHPNFGQPGQGQPQWPGQQPLYAPQFQQPQFQAPPPGVPLAPPAQAPQQQPAPAQQPGLSLDTIIPRGSQDWPQELWGRPVREAMRIYNIMKEDFLWRNRQQAQPPQQQPQQPQYQQQPSAQPRPQMPPGGVPASLDMDSIQRMIQDGIRQGLAQSPMASVTAETVMSQVRMRYPDWNQYHMEILQAIQGAGPELLMNPSTWESAYYLVKGRALSVGQTPTYQPQYDPYQANGNGQGHRDPTGAIRTPPPAFTEAPSAPPPPTNGAAALTNDPRIINMARRFGVDPAVYAADYARQMGQG